MSSGRARWRAARRAAIVRGAPARSRTVPVTLIQLAILAAIQGVTEFLPVSSSGHLVLVPAVAGWPDQGLLIDVAVHVGTLLAVVVYLWPHLRRMLQLSPGGSESGRRLLGQTALATAPVLVAGGLVFFYAGSILRSAEIVGWATLVFGILLYLADRYAGTSRQLDDMTWGRALLIGLAQILALVPGSSRAGVTITAGRLLGFERADAARFSMLLAIPAIVAAGGAGAWKLWSLGALQLAGEALVAAAIAFVTAIVAIRLMMNWIRRSSFTPFVIYRVALGGAILAWVYF